MTPINLDLHQNNKNLYFVTYFNTLEKELRTIQIEKDQIEIMLSVLQKGNYTGINVYKVSIDVSSFDINKIQESILDI